MPRPRGRISSREVDQASASNAGARATHEKSCKGLVLGCARAASAANTTAAGHAEVAASAAAAGVVGPPPVVVGPPPGVVGPPPMVISTPALLGSGAGAAATLPAVGFGNFVVCQFFR